MAGRSLQTLLLVIVAACVLTAARTVCALSDEPPRITDIRFTGLKRVSREKALAAIRLRPGDRVTAQGVDEDIRRLDELGCFYPVGISVRQEDHRDGVRLIFDLVERPIISGIRFEGARAFNRKKLFGAVGLKAGDYLDFALQKLSTARIEDIYRNKGYQFVEVKRDDAEDRANNSVAITFTVKEGPQVRFEAIRFRGNKVFPDGKLLQQMETRTRTLFFFRNRFDESKFKLDLLRVQEFYRRNGYLDAQVSGDYEYSLDRTELTVFVTVVEGARYTVGDVTVRGQTVATADDLTKDLKLKKGEPFSTLIYDQDAKTLQSYYTARGYLRVRIERRQLYPQAGRIDLIYNIAENKQYRLGRFDIRGNKRTKDKVIRREFGLYPGDVFDMGLMRRGLARLRMLRYFDRVEESVVPGEDPDEFDLLVEVEEGRTGNLMFGGGVSSNYGVIGQLQISFENFDIADLPKDLDDLFTGDAFVGAGQRLILRWMPGTQVSQARLFFSDPHIFDTDFSFSTDLFTYDRMWEDYDESRYGFRVGVGRRLMENLTARVAYRLEQVKVRDLEWDAAPDVRAVEGNNDIRSITTSVNYDRTDDIWQPSQGYRAGASVEVADEALGSDWNFIKGIVDASYYRRLYTTRAGSKHVLAVNGRVGAVDAFDGQHMVPTFERFFAGGRNSVRGFSYRGLGPEQNGTAVGGEFAATGTVEYRFPIYAGMVQGRHYEMIRGVVFVDAGQVAYTTDDIGGTTWRASVGFGIRFHVPGLGGIPIAMDWGFPVAKDDDDDRQVFSFMIGTSF